MLKATASLAQNLLGSAVVGPLLADLLQDAVRTCLANSAVIADEGAVPSWLGSLVTGKLALPQALSLVSPGEDTIAID